ncbi:MAG: FkbM family methyltransferase [Halioglobus sp.]|nr:FkbM family methyltransferase [Halioglobus sp.]
MKKPPVLVTLFLIVIAGSTAIQAQDLSESEQAIQEESALNEFMVEVIERLRDDHEAIPDKTGILAEKSLYSVGAEELIIRDFFKDRKNGIYVDVGCAWAVDYSNTYYLEERLGWVGIGIDALNDYAAEWEEKRPASKFRNYLITSTSGGEGVFYRSSSLGLSSTNEKMASGGTFGFQEENEEIRVPMITLNDLLDQEGITKIDLLSMDIEGHEPEALAGFDIERFAPELFVIEGTNKTVEALLNKYGYYQIERYARYDPLNRYFARAENAIPEE